MKTLLKQLSDRLPPRVSSAGEAFAALVLLAGAILRAAGYTRSAIWFDEAVPLYRASLPFWEMLHNRSEFSGNMLWEIILRPFVWLSRELWSLRLPALLCGMGTLWLAWRMMKRLSFSGKEMAFASVFIAFFPGLIWPAQDAKQYSLLTFLFLLAADFAVEARWLGLFATCGLLTYTHLVGPAYGIGALAMAWYLHPKELKRLLGIGAGMLLSWMPYLLWSLRLPIGHLQVGQISPASLLYSLGVLMWYTTLPKLGWAYSHLLIVFGSALALITKEKRQVALVLLLAATFGSMLFVSMTFRNVMIYRTMSGLLAPIGLFLGSSLAAEFPPAGSG
ncbi:MAG: hypothetical protein NZL98_07220, partial [Anaerolineales bacterium]|nr:hypothetical protein [Anaerolineales bacterium]